MVCCVAVPAAVSVVQQLQGTCLPALQPHASVGLTTCSLVFLMLKSWGAVTCHLKAIQMLGSKAATEALEAELSRGQAQPPCSSALSCQYQKVRQQGLRRTHVQAFAALTDVIKADRYLQPHYRYYVREVRKAAYVQVRPYLQQHVLHGSSMCCLYKPLHEKVQSSYTVTCLHMG